MCRRPFGWGSTFRGISSALRRSTSRGGASGGSARRRLVTHTGPIPTGQWQVIDGMRVTTPARTGVDVARTAPFPGAVALADHVIRRFAQAPLREEMTAIAAMEAGRHGMSRARAVVAFADPRAESGGESVSRALLAKQGLPAPDLQLEIRGPGGAFVARCDMGWREERTVGEFDGRVKYQGGLTPGQDPGQVVFREKIREDRLRELGWEVVR